MKITADKYFDDYRLMDFWLISTLGFNEKDIEEISKLENIEGIAPLVMPWMLYLKMEIMKR